MAPLDQLREHRSRIAALQQRPVVAAGHPRDQHVKIGAQPYRDAAPCDPRAGGRVHERAPAGRENMRRLLQQPRDDTALAVAKHGFAAVAENFLDRLAGGGLDLVIRIEERQVQPDRQAPSDFCLARAHQPDQDDCPPRR